ncbi:MAG TPA: glycerophosphodiester phosphodiesterase [Candidatus Limnocylindrales bacterium]|nr:glycerophosphodiester phosphodiesterase [Candidatus Limnocylindrales bacterium]
MTSPRPTHVPSRRPIAFAHRGASAHAPENTIEAFALALQLGATGLESDVWLAADGVPVLVHDRRNTWSGRRVDVTATSSADLAAFGVPSLGELYESVGDTIDLSLDLEHVPVALPTVEIAARRGAASRLWACSPDVGLLRQLRRHDADVRLVCSTRPRRVEGGLTALIASLADDGIDALNMHWRDWTSGLVDAIHRAGLRAFAWDAQEPLVIDRTLELGVDAIYSDWPERLAEAIAARAVASS